MTYRFHALAYLKAYFSMLSMGEIANSGMDIGSLFNMWRQQTRTVHYPKQQVVFSQGDRSDALFHIEAGTVKLTVTSSSGKEALIGCYDAGKVFGESCLLAGNPIRFHNAIAVTKLEVLRIDNATMLRRIHSDPKVGYAFLTWALARNHQIQSQLVSRLLASSEERLARVLSFVDQLGTEKSELGPKLTQQDLANMVGLSRQRVNMLLGQLKKDGRMDI